MHHHLETALSVELLSRRRLIAPPAATKREKLKIAEMLICHGTHSARELGAHLGWQVSRVRRILAAMTHDVLKVQDRWKMR
jgi:transcription initiation factor IIE alpha subunit